MRRRGVLFALALGLALATTSASAERSAIVYRRAEVAGVVTHLLSLAPAQVELRVLDSRDHDKSAMSAEEFATATGAAAVINGPFFDIDGSPMGLLVVDGTEKQGLRKADWGVFYVDGKGAHVVHTSEYRSPPGVKQAFQVGPRLVVDGAPLALKPQSARRTALCTRKGGEVLMLVTEGALQAKDLAEFLAAERCVHALNLDGGPSSQLYLHSGELKVHEGGGTAVPIALGVFPRGAVTQAESEGRGCL